MDDEIELNDDGVGREMVVVEGRTPTRQQNAQRGIKRSAPTTPASARKQQIVTSTPTHAPPPLSIRGAPATILTTPRNDSTDNVTYRLVQIAGPADNVQRHQSIVQQATTTHIITTNGQGEFVASSGQPIVINSGGLTTFGSTADQTPTRVAYVPAGAISVATSPATINQPIQLQSFDSGGGQYYIMLPSGSEFIQTGPTTPVAATPTSTRLITAPRLQQAAFIPLSRLEPVHATTLTNVQSASATAHVKQLDFSGESAPAGKEVKRRVSHNEVEKRRRDKINNWISKLARVVPNAANEFSTAKMPQSKGGVLAKTVEYIQELRETNDQVVDALRQFESMVNCLKDENKQLRDLLQQAGIQAPPAVTFEYAVTADSIVAANSEQPESSSLAGNVTVSSSADTSVSIDPSTSSAYAVSGATVVGLSKNAPRQYVLVQTSKGLGLMRNPAQDRTQDESSGEEHSEQD